MNEHEAAFVRAFVRRERRDRYLLLLAGPAKRRKILDRLQHRAWVDFLLPPPLPKAARNAAAVEALLRTRGAPDTCRVIAHAHEFEGREVRLAEALAAAEVHDFGMIVSCVPGRLVFLKGEEVGVWFLLEKEKGP